MDTAHALLARNVLPDWLIRRGVRRQLAQRLAECESEARDPQHMWRFVQDLRTREIAEQTQAANEQHYEVPPEFYRLVLGPQLKYSSAYFSDAAQSLAQAEADMLQRTVAFGRLKDGMDVLDLGCGWGSLTLYIARRFPRCRITSLSNSWAQRKLIEGVCDAEKLTNVSVETGDVSVWDTSKSFDRVFSIEMFEHMKNYGELLRKVSAWLRPKAQLLVHHFCHREYAYHFESDGASNWMGKYFFSGGTMPSNNLLLYFQSDLHCVDTWKINGEHYSRTLEAWLRTMDERIEQVRPVLRVAYGAQNATKFEAYWRVFFIACSELFRYNDGWEWYVVQWLFEKP